MFAVPPGFRRRAGALRVTGLVAAAVFALVTSSTPRLLAAEPDGVPPATNERRVGPFGVLGGLGYSSMTLPVSYRGQAYSLGAAHGPTLMVGARARLDLSQSWFAEARGTFTYARVTSSTADYDFGGGLPEGALHAFLPALDVALGARIGPIVLRLGPTAALLMPAGSVGSGTSKSGVRGVFLQIGAGLELGVPLGDAPWEIAARFGGTFAVGHYNSDFGREGSLLLTRAL